MSDDDEAERRLGHLRDQRVKLEASLSDVRSAITAETVACLNEGLAPASIARAAGLSRQAVYDIKRAAEEEQAQASE